jgi:hypothetical protein
VKTVPTTYHSLGFMVVSQTDHMNDTDFRCLG